MKKMCFNAIFVDFPRKSLFSKENYGWRKSIVLEYDEQKDGGKKNIKKYAKKFVESRGL